MTRSWAGLKHTQCTSWCDAIARVYYNIILCSTQSYYTMMIPDVGGPAIAGQCCAYLYAWLNVGCACVLFYFTRMFSSWKLGCSKWAEINRGLIIYHLWLRADVLCNIHNSLWIHKENKCVLGEVLLTALFPEQLSAALLLKSATLFMYRTVGISKQCRECNSFFYRR